MLILVINVSNPSLKRVATEAGPQGTTRDRQNVTESLLKGDFVSVKSCCIPLKGRDSGIC